MALLYSTLIFVIFFQLSNTSKTRSTPVKVEIDENFTPRRHEGRGIDSNCKCAKPGQYSFFDDNTCKPKRESTFPARVAECKCKECKLNITFHCTCDEHNNLKWKATKNICTVSHSSTSKTPYCYDSPPTNAVMDFDRCRRGYNGETAHARCQFSCRPVQVICKSNGNWQYSNVSEKCSGEEGNPTYSDTNPDGLSFTIDANGNIFGFLCLAGHLMVRDDENPAKCRSGAIIGNFPTCVRNSTQITEPSSLSTTVTTLFTQNGIETTSYQEKNNPANVMKRSPKSEDTPLGWVEYLLIVVIVVFLVILAGLWSWYAKDKMRVARLKRAAVDNRNGHPCIL